MTRAEGLLNNKKTDQPQRAQSSPRMLNMRYFYNSQFSVLSVAGKQRKLRDKRIQAWQYMTCGWFKIKEPARQESPDGASIDQRHRHNTRQ